MKTRKEFQEKIEAQLKIWKAEFEALKTKMQAEHNDQLTDLIKKQEVIERDLAEMKQTSGRTWETLKTKIEQDLTELQIDFNQFIKSLERNGHDAFGWA